MTQPESQFTSLTSHLYSQTGSHCLLSQKSNPFKLGGQPLFLKSPTTLRAFSHSRSSISSPLMEIVTSCNESFAKPAECFLHKSRGGSKIKDSIPMCEKLPLLTAPFPQEAMHYFSIWHMLNSCENTGSSCEFFKKKS